MRKLGSLNINEKSLNSIQILTRPSAGDTMHCQSEIFDGFLVPDDIPLDGVLNKRFLFGVLENVDNNAEHLAIGYEEQIDDETTLKLQLSLLEENGKITDFDFTKICENGRSRAKIDGGWASLNYTRHANVNQTTQRLYESFVRLPQSRRDEIQQMFTEYKSNITSGQEQNKSI